MNGRDYRGASRYQKTNESATMPVRNVNLTLQLDQFIETGVRTGRFTGASDMVREGLELLSHREREDTAKVEWLRTAAREGFDSIDRGDGLAFASMDDLEAWVHRVGEAVSNEIASGRERA